MGTSDLQELIDFYGLAPDSADALRGALLTHEPRPIVLVNLLALRENAAYDDARPSTGAEAMLRYAAVSAERLAAVGGHFLHQGLCTGPRWGEDGSHWNVVVVGSYPSGNAVLELLRDPEYHAAYAHRRAAVADQRVLVSTPLA